MAFDRQIAAMTCYCEASSAMPFERQCVIHTMFNRLHTPGQRFGTTIAAICLKRAQYSEWNGDRVNSANLMRAAHAADSDPIMLDCLTAYSEVADGALPDPTNGSTHYFDKSISAPYWAVLPGVETLVTAHFHFWRNVA
jgi:hypothetical protein